jgi:hypothetical protein
MDPDPDPAIFVIDLQDASKKLFFFITIKESRFFLLFLHDDRRIRIRIQSRIRIHNPD